METGDEVAAGGVAVAVGRERARRHGVRRRARGGAVPRRVADARAEPEGGRGRRGRARRPKRRAVRVTAGEARGRRRGARRAGPGHARRREARDGGDHRDPRTSARGARAVRGGVSERGGRPASQKRDRVRAREHAASRCEKEKIRAGRKISEPDGRGDGGGVMTRMDADAGRGGGQRRPGGRGRGRRASEGGERASEARRARPRAGRAPRARVARLARRAGKALQTPRAGRRFPARAVFCWFRGGGKKRPRRIPPSTPLASTRARRRDRGGGSLAIAPGIAPLASASRATDPSGHGARAAPPNHRAAKEPREAHVGAGKGVRKSVRRARARASHLASRSDSLGAYPITERASSFRRDAR